MNINANKLLDSTMGNEKFTQYHVPCLFWITMLALTMAAAHSKKIIRTVAPACAWRAAVWAKPVTRPAVCCATGTLIFRLCRTRLPPYPYTRIAAMVIARSPSRPAAPCARKQVASFFRSFATITRTKCPPSNPLITTIVTARTPFRPIPGATFAFVGHWARDHQNKQYWHLSQHKQPSMWSKHFELERLDRAWTVCGRCLANWW